jgi:hypothetical protein
MTADAFAGRLFGAATSSLELASATASACTGRSR